MNQITYPGIKARRYIGSCILGALIGISVAVPSAFALEQVEETASSAPIYRLVERMRLDETQVAAFTEILNNADEQRFALNQNTGQEGADGETQLDMNELRSALQTIDQQMFAELQNVLYSDQLQAFEVLTLQNKMHGLTPDGRPLPEMARSGKVHRDQGDIDQEVSAND